MMKGLLLLVLLWNPYSSAGNLTLNLADDKEDFYSFVIRINEIQNNVILQELFSNLERGNFTDKCSQDLKTYRDSIDIQEEWAISLLDSSGISFSGLLSGNTMSLGSYKQCLSTSPKNFSSSYCTMEINISNESNFTLPLAPENVTVTFSLCLPDTCNNEQLETLLETSTSENKAKMTVECQSKRPGMTFADFFIVFIIVLVWIVIISTYMPKKWIPIKNEVFHQIWDSFSFQRNLDTLLKTGHTSLSSIQGIRVLSQCSIVIHHIFVWEQIGNYPILNKFSYWEFIESWAGAIVTELMLAVNTFFVIAGILLTWNCLEFKRKFNLVRYYIHRYLRLTPAYLATILITMTFVHKLCDGPICNSLDEESQICARYWWSNLLYINNFIPTGMGCLGHCWYLAADWQLFFFISPFVVIVINKWPQHLYKLIIAIFSTSVVISFLLSYLMHFPIERIYRSPDNNWIQNKALHMSPSLRAGPWAIGMLCGVFLHKFKKNELMLSKKTHLIAWTLSVIGICLSFELVQIFIKMPSIEGSVWSALYYTILPNLWALSISWVIFSSETQKAGFIGRFLSWTVFQTLGKLTYSAYLVHMLIIRLYFSAAYGSNNISLATQVPLALGLIFLSYAVGFMLYLSFEAPSAHLQNILFGKATRGDLNLKVIGGNNSAPEITTVMRNSIQDSNEK